MVQYIEIVQFAIEKRVKSAGYMSHPPPHEARDTPPEKVDEWLPTVHTIISNLKRYLLGTYHGVSSTYLQEYIDEFVFRFICRSW